MRDDESNPAKGVLAARELVQREKVAALFGGLDTPVSMAIVPFANRHKVPFMGVWAAGTPITHNGAAENYVFRVSAVDELVDKALRRLRDQEVRRQEARHDPDQQSVGRVQREGPQGGARREEDAAMPASRSSRTTMSTWCRN